MSAAGPEPGRRAAALRLAVSLFTVLPVPTDHDAELGRSQAARALHWLPAVGAGLGLLSAMPALAVWRGGAGNSVLLAAVLVVGLHALLTRGLHLDGLADLADGLGSGRPAEQALAVMRRSDIGPFGVAAILTTVLLQVTALGAILPDGSRPQALVAISTAVMIGRVAAVWAAGTGIPAARPGGFGSLVAASASRPARVASTVAALTAATGGGLLAGERGSALIALTGSALAGLVIAGLVRRHAVRRLGGVTGDVFGALIEIGTTGTLVVLAATLTWR